MEESGRVVFTDFEYAGLDDPAKLVCDFFCQPDVPPPLEHYARFVEKVIGGLDLRPVHEARCRLLMDAYRLKWICIILNDFPRSRCCPAGLRRHRRLGPALRSSTSQGREAKIGEVQAA